jgi:hypothetical protein
LMEYMAAARRLRTLPSSAPSKVRGSRPRSSGAIAAAADTAAKRSLSWERFRWWRSAPWPPTAVLALLMSLRDSFTPPPSLVLGRGDPEGSPRPEAERRLAEVGNLEAAGFSSSPHTDRAPLRGVDDDATAPPGLTNELEDFLPAPMGDRRTGASQRQAESHGVGLRGVGG